MFFMYLGTKDADKAQRSNVLHYLLARGASDVILAGRLPCPWPFRMPTCVGASEARIFSFP